MASLDPLSVFRLLIYLHAADAVDQVHARVGAALGGRQVEGLDDTRFNG
ncbi:hypothetical protein [Micromonospora violae]|nr:hypothetical protein [Micromonospora violae]